MNQSHCCVSGDDVTECKERSWFSLQSWHFSTQFLLGAHADLLNFMIGERQMGKKIERGKSNRKIRQTITWKENMERFFGILFVSNKQKKACLVL